LGGPKALIGLKLKGFRVGGKAKEVGLNYWDKKVLSPGTLFNWALEV